MEKNGIIKIINKKPNQKTARKKGIFQNYENNKFLYTNQSCI